MELDVLVGNIIGRADGRGPGIVVVELPGGDGAILAQPAADVYHPRGAKVSPGELLLARPLELHRPACGPRQSRRLHSGFARVLAAVRAARVRYLYPHLILRKTEHLREFRPHAEGTLRAYPHRQFAILPLRYRRARFEGRVSDIGYGVGRLQLVLCLGSTFVHGTYRVVGAAFPTRFFRRVSL